MALTLELRRFYDLCQAIVYQLKAVMRLHKGGNILIACKFRKLF